MGMRPAARLPKLTRRSRILILIALGVIVLLLAGPRLIDAYVDWLWFGELGYRSVFTTVLVTRIVVFLVAGVLVGGIVFAGLALAYRTRPVFVPSSDNDPVARYRALAMSRLRLLGIGIPAAIANDAKVCRIAYGVRCSSTGSTTSTAGSTATRTGSPARSTEASPHAERDIREPQGTTRAATRTRGRLQVGEGSRQGSEMANDLAGRKVRRRASTPTRGTRRRELRRGPTAVLGGSAGSSIPGPALA